MSGPHDEFIAWASGRTDAMGQPFGRWLLARRNPDGTAVRDEAGRQLFETQADYLARQGAKPQATTTPQLDLFAA